MKSAFFKTICIASLLCTVPAVSSAQSFANNLAAASVDPVSDSIAISRVRARLDSIRRTENRPTVAVVLSGGGAKGAAYIGILRYMEELGIPVDYVCGTSMGGLVGGLYALGYDSHELETIFTTVDWHETMSDDIDMKFKTFEKKENSATYLLSIPFYYDDIAHIKRNQLLGQSLEDDSEMGTSENKKKILSTLPMGYIEGFNIDHILSSLSVNYHEDMLFDELPIPFCCVSSDLVSAKANYHTEGSLPEALRATMSIPGVFAPVRTQSKILVDGGTRNNFPVDMARAVGADIVIGAEAAKRGATYSEVNSAIDILDCMITMLGDDARSNKEAQPDMFIRPETGEVKTLSFNAEAINELISSGYESARAMTDEFMKIKERVGECGKQIRPKAVNLFTRNVPVAGIMVRGINTDEQKMFRKVLALKGYRDISIQEIKDAMSRVLATGAFENVTYSLLKIPNEDNYTLEFKCVPGQIHNFSLGMRVDTEEMAEIIMNTTLNAHRLRGWKYALTLKFSKQQSADLGICYIPDKFAQVNFRATAELGRFDIISQFKNRSYNVSLFTSNQEFFLSTPNATVCNVKGGLRHQILSVPDDMPLVSIPEDLSSLIDYPDYLRKGEYITAFFNADFNTLNDRQFPTKGLRSSMGAEYDMANLSLDYFTAVPILYFNGEILLPATRWLTVTPSVWWRSYFSEDDQNERYRDHMHQNYVGGALMGRYLPQQIPFVGFGDISEVQDHVYELGLDAQFQLLEKLFFTTKVAVVREESEMPDMFDGISPSFWGCAAEIGYRTPLGPAKLNVHWADSDYHNGVGFYFSLGFDF